MEEDMKSCRQDLQQKIVDDFPSLFNLDGRMEKGRFIASREREESNFIKFEPSNENRRQLTLKKCVKALAGRKVTRQP